MQKHLVLVGAGHAHLTTLKDLDVFVAAGHRVTVVSAGTYQYYSGMGPGMLAGTYQPREARFDVKRMVETAAGEYGRIDVFVNVAGVLGFEAVTRITLAEWSRILDTNLTGAMMCCREVCRHMVANRAGSIVIISSTIQFMAIHREAAYRASKTGLQVFAETAALEMAPYGIRVNTISPGVVYSEHWSKDTIGPALKDPVLGPKLLETIPLGRVGKPEDIGDAAVFLASDRCPYVTGANLVIDGGFSLRPLVLVSQEAIHKVNLPEP